ncbi:hypothetical protein [Singulisphaera sp. PoT]|uniref:hypothetical protein n=1 Tax=Singulisphaera sp. PoT TaxID=3411797 RepID=UPI003BF46653
MSYQVDFSWDSIPNEGISASDGMHSPYNPVANEELFQAWCQERHESIELKLFLDEALVLLKRVLAEDVVSHSNRKRVTQLVKAIRVARANGCSPSSK